jgi:hypothetical protein
MDNTQAVHPPWKKGDWCFYEFTLSVIEDMSPDGRVQGVADGYFRRGGSNLSEECLPLTKLNKVLSEEFTKLSDRLHAIKGANLNYPDLHTYLVRKWRDCCDLVHTDEQRDMLRTEVRHFVAHVEQTANGLRSEVLDGVQLFR